MAPFSWRSRRNFAYNMNMIRVRPHVWLLALALVATTLAGATPVVAQETPAERIESTTPTLQLEKTPAPAKRHVTTRQAFIEAYYLVRNRYVEDATPERLLSAAVQYLIRDATNAPPVAELLALPAAQPVRDRDCLDAFTQAMARVRRELRPTASLSDLLEEAIIGMVESLNDPYSRYLAPDEHSELTEYISGERGRYVGVGIHIGLDEGYVTVVRPIEGSPAFERGIMAGDRILAVDGIDVTNTKVLEDVVSKIKGPEETVVTLTIERHGLPAPLDIDIVRRPVTPKNIDYAMVAPRIGWARLYTFSQHSVAELEHALHWLELAGAEALVLDLRQDPGGLLEAAVGVSALFLPHGADIVEVKGRDPRGYRREKAVRQPVWVKPVVLLVDGASASASEIVTGALKDNGRARVVGERTFGKGSVQQVFELDNTSNGAALRLSTALYYTPSGAMINHKGIEPDVVALYERPASNRATTAAATGENGPTPTPDPNWWVRIDTQLQAAIREAERAL